MIRSFAKPHAVRSRPMLPFALLVAGFASVGALSAFAAAAAPAGRVQGRIVAVETGEPIGFADVVLFPSDTTLKRVAGQTNADGTFLLEAAPGTYTLQVRALSYSRKRIEGVVVEAGRLLPFSTGLKSEAIQQEEVVVEARARQNTESSMLAARKRSAAVGDAVSAEQVRKSPDKDAAEVLRRVTGLSVSDGKYVFVRGLGERYSSTEVDGVRIASPEENKRVVPLDLLPASLVENIVVQKTYTADRPGEFGGGDVQVRTRDFPGRRLWSFGLSRSAVEGVTGRSRQSYDGGRSNLFGFSAHDRELSGVLGELFPGRGLPSVTYGRGGPKPSPALTTVARSFRDVWSATSTGTPMNSGYTATYGDELKVLGRPLGWVGSVSASRAYSDRSLSHRTYTDVTDTLVDYPTRTSVASAQLGGLSAVSFRLSPRHTIHARGFYTNSADDEVTTYQGQDFQRDEALTGTHLVHDVTVLKYVERNITSGSVEGQHEFSHLLGANIDWKLSRSRARRLQPDMREVVYDKRYWYDGDPGHWTLGSQGVREFGDLKDRGWGTTIASSVPLRLGAFGNGKLALGYDRQTKKRDNAYRRFGLTAGTADPNLLLEDPETIFDPANFDTLVNSGYVVENTFGSRTLSDNYTASQRVSAEYVSLDLPLGRRVRSNLGLRLEDSDQDVRGFAVFHPEETLQEGRFSHVDRLPSMNLTWSVRPTINARFAASRTLSRPDINELSPSPSGTYVNDFMILGNPRLKRFLIDNYDLRFEAFPSLSEVFAIGGFYKHLHHPIERTIQAGALRALIPFNTGEGFDRGLELEARMNLGRAAQRLQRFSVNTNASFIASRVDVGASSKQGTLTHPLQGQANYLVNAALSWTSAGNRTDVTVMATSAGKRLKLLGFAPLPDVYEQPITSLDATLNWAPYPNTRLKLAAKNLLDPAFRTLQGNREAESYRAGRAFSLAFTLGS
jgi:outer membrane receptor protein involved in Fe transport